MSSFILTIYQGVFSIFNTIISILLLPLDALLENIIPNYSSMSVYVDNFFSFFEDTIYFVLSWFHIPTVAFDFILGYISFRVLLFFGTLSYKLFIRWYSALKV